MQIGSGKEVMNRRTIKLMIILGISIISFTACGVRKEFIQEEEPVIEETTIEEETSIEEEVEEIPIMVWISGEDTGQNAEYQNIEGFEYIQKAFWGNDGRTAEYEDRQTFLGDFGFGDKEPLYQFYDRSHNLQMEIYLDEESLKGCGIRYKYYSSSEIEKAVSMYGFTFDTVYEQKWVEPDIFSVKAYDGGDGAGSVSEYEEYFEYTEDGKLDYFKSQGVIDWLGDEEDEKEPSDILKINFVYRDDGTLYRKEYVHNSFVFGTTCSTIESLYDEKERLLYEDCYITHGSYEYYYIYEDDGKKPAYCLGVDDNLGYFIPIMMQFQ